MGMGTFFAVGEDEGGLRGVEAGGWNAGASAADVLTEQRKAPIAFVHAMPDVRVRCEYAE